MKYRYNVSLETESVDKIMKVLKVANITLSGYLSLLVDEFARIIDEEGISKKLDNLTMADTLHLMGNLMAGIEEEKKKANAERIKRKEEKKRLKLKS
jgi:hypothetical protein